jgi:hypothetical protein
MKIKPFFLLCLLNLFLSTCLWGDSIPNVYLENERMIKEINAADWEKATKDLHYDGDIKRIKKEKTGPSSSLSLVFWKVLAVLILLGIIFLLLRYLVGAQGIQPQKNRKFDPNEEIDTQVVAENIHEFDIGDLLNQAIEQKNYTVATRLYYLTAIKALSDKDLIQWSKNKTNRNYLNEISEHSLKKQFKIITNIFERIWYGETAIDEMTFEEIQQPFQQFIQRIR